LPGDFNARIWPLGHRGCLLRHGKKHRILDYLALGKIKTPDPFTLDPDPFTLDPFTLDLFSDPFTLLLTLLFLLYTSTILTKIRPKVVVQFSKATIQAGVRWDRLPFQFPQECLVRGRFEGDHE
jgi:hypothetical protein